MNETFKLRIANSEPNPVLAGQWYESVHSCTGRNQYGNKETAEEKRDNGEGGVGRKGEGGRGRLANMSVVNTGGPWTASGPLHPL